jgi:hypothetical protein
VQLKPDSSGRADLAATGHYETHNGRGQPECASVYD